MDKFTIKKKLNEIIKSTNKDVAILVKDLSKNEMIFNYNGDKTYVSASIIKLPIMIEILKRVQDLGMLSISLQRKMMDFEAIKMGKNNYTSLEDMLTRGFCS